MGQAKHFGQPAPAGALIDRAASEPSEAQPRTTVQRGSLASIRQRPLLSALRA